MPKVTVICYLSSLLFYGMGYSKMVVLNTEPVNAYNFSIQVSLAMVYFVLTIFLAVIGSFFFYIKYLKYQKIKFQVKADRGLNAKRRASVQEAKTHLSQSKYGMQLERRMSS